MGLSNYLNKDILNLKFSDALAMYDSDQNGYTRQEFSKALNGVTSIFARCIIKISNYDKVLFDELDTDKNNVVSYEEISNYIKDKYELDFSKLSSMTMKEACAEYDRIRKDKKDN